MHGRDRRRRQRPPSSILSDRPRGIQGEAEESKARRGAEVGESQRLVACGVYMRSVGGGGGGGVSEEALREERATTLFQVPDKTVAGGAGDRGRRWDEMDAEAVHGESGHLDTYMHRRRREQRAASVYHDLTASKGAQDVGLWGSAFASVCCVRRRSRRSRHPTRRWAGTSRGEHDLSRRPLDENRCASIGAQSSTPWYWSSARSERVVSVGIPPAGHESQPMPRSMPIEVFSRCLGMSDGGGIVKGESGDDE
ncbi:hypothetical protein R3P38DRAFT_1630357 [Favolaschia claudopus]|uniref:Uncharacterized protein n=1 Tax=Favolaschia claudopus TaxID=2862362 RepID=A0AAW0DM87_9AGAR